MRDAIPLSPGRQAQCDRLRAALAQLSEREYDILMARFSNYDMTGGKQEFDPAVLADLCERWQVTKDYVRQIFSRTLRKLKAQLTQS
jgi:DNA-directed RNA polymerase sigma subunit (sigma70/sigma32)